MKCIVIHNQKFRMHTFEIVRELCQVALKLMHMVSKKKSISRIILSNVNKKTSPQTGP